jgi:hypothetical protein
LWKEKDFAIPILFKMKSFPKHFQIAMLDKDNNPKRNISSVTCEPTIISLMPWVLNHLYLRGQAEKFYSVMGVFRVMFEH